MPRRRTIEGRVLDQPAAAAAESALLAMARHAALHHGGASASPQAAPQRRVMGAPRPRTSVEVSEQGTYDGGKLQSRKLLSKCRVCFARGSLFEEK